MKNWYKVTWTELYQNYILPTNPGSKNPIIATLWWKKRVAEIVQKKIRNKGISYFKEQLFWSKLYALVHIFWFIFFAYRWYQTYNSMEIIYVNIILNLLINVYPIMVQIHVHQRVNRIMNHMKNKSTSR